MKGGSSILDQVHINFMDFFLAADKLQTLEQSAPWLRLRTPGDPRLDRCSIELGLSPPPNPCLYQSGNTKQQSINVPLAADRGCGARDDQPVPATDHGSGARDDQPVHTMVG